MVKDTKQQLKHPHRMYTLPVHLYLKIHSNIHLLLISSTFLTKEIRPGRQVAGAQMQEPEPSLGAQPNSPWPL